MPSRHLIGQYFSSGNFLAITPATLLSVVGAKASKARATSVQLRLIAAVATSELGQGFLQSYNDGINFCVSADICYADATHMDNDQSSSLHLFFFSQTIIV